MVLGGVEMETVFWPDQDQLRVAGTGLVLHTEEGLLEGRIVTKDFRLQCGESTPRLVRCGRQLPLPPPEQLPARLRQCQLPSILALRHRALLARLLGHRHAHRQPPGFPPRPQYAASPGYSIPLPRPTIPVSSVSSDGRELSPRTANCRALTAAFKDADLKPNIKLETSALKKADPNGDLVEDDDGKKTYTFTNRVVYQYGHGREKCTRTKCYGLLQIALAKFPNNCGFNKQWLPEKFEPCGEYCSGGFFLCLRRYNNTKTNHNKDGKRRK